MLRILVISLFVANLLLFAFQDNDQPVAPVETGVTKTDVKDSSIPTIHLYSEMVQDQGLMSGNRQCFSIGPFHTVEDTDEVYARLLEVTVNISERQTQALVEKGYWVFMPPYASLLEANQALLSLQALGLKDIGVIYDGDWKSAISLGYFLRQENARKRKKSLEDRGYAPLIRVQRQSEPRYWLDYEQNPGSGLIALDMQNRSNDFMQRSLPCPEQDLFETPTVESQAAIGDVTQGPAPERDKDSDPNQSLETEAAETEPDMDGRHEATAPESENGEDVLPPGQGASTDSVEIGVNPDDQNLESPLNQDAIADPVQNEVVETGPKTDRSEEEQALELEQGEEVLLPEQNAGSDSGEIVESVPEDSSETDPGQSLESETGQKADSGAETREPEPGNEDDLMSRDQGAGTHVGEIIESPLEFSVGTGPDISIETAPVGTEKETVDDDGVDEG